MAKQSLKDRIAAGEFKQKGRYLGFLRLSKEDQKAVDEIARSFLADELNGATKAETVRGLNDAGVKVSKGVFEGYLNVLKKKPQG